MKDENISLLGSLLFGATSLNRIGYHAKGGGGGGSQRVDSSPPPPTTSSVEVQQAQRDAARQAAKRKGLTSTILAGETGGYNPLQSASSGNNLLGGPRP